VTESHAPSAPQAGEQQLTAWGGAVDPDDDDVLEPIELNPIWQQDNVTLHSVGIDIGSSGTQIAFSRLHLRRLGEDLTSRYVVVRRDTLFQSEVQLTPYVDDKQIDAEALGRIIDDAYQRAGQDPDGIDTGVVILTGEALRRRNSRRIADVLAAQGGELVCASAGHNMEAMLAAYGSGAARTSYDQASRILNVDIGGGTTKLGVLEHGKVVATAAIHIGGRLQVIDAAGRIVRLEPAGRDHAARAGFDWSVGDTIDPADLDHVAEVMADTLIAALCSPPLPPRVRELYLTEPLEDLGALDGVIFSGGVAEYVYEQEVRDFGDLGARLGAAIRRRIAAGQLPAPLLPMGERIRATVLGASEYSVQLSGNTSYISDPKALLPRRNLQVLRPAYEVGETVDSENIASAILGHLAAFDVEHPEADVALALEWDGLPAYERIAAFANGITAGLAERIAHQRPLYLLLEGDIALTLGSVLRDEHDVTGELMVIDGVSLWDFDYIDLGTIRWPSGTVPVTIKSLVFSEDPRAAFLTVGSGDVEKTATPR